LDEIFLRNLRYGDNSWQIGIHFTANKVVNNNTVCAGILCLYPTLNCFAPIDEITKSEQLDFTIDLSFISNLHAVNIMYAEKHLSSRQHYLGAY